MAQIAKIADVSGWAIASGWAALAGATAQVEGLSTAGVIFAASAGAAVAVMFRLVDSKRPEPGKIWARTARHFVSWFIGATVGVFMGSSLAGNTPLDEKGAIFLMGLTGHVFVALFLSERGRRWMAKRIGMGDLTND